MGAGFGPGTKKRGFIRFADAFGVMENFDKTLPCNHHPSLRINGEAENICGQVVIGIERYFEPRRNLKTLIFFLSGKN